jgi:hypothetical protein
LNETDFWEVKDRGSGQVVGYTEVDAVLSRRSGSPVSYETEESHQTALHLGQASLAGSRRIVLPPPELAAAIILQRQATIVIMDYGSMQTVFEAAGGNESGAFAISYSLKKA